MSSTRIIFVAIAIAILCALSYALTYTGKGEKNAVTVSLPPATVSLVSFNLVCEKPDASCFKATVKDTRTDIFVENTPLLTLADIASASVVPHVYPQKMLDYLKARGIQKAVLQPYRLSLTFKDPGILTRISSANIGRKIAIFIDGDVATAPAITRPISVNALDIESAYITEAKARELADKINRAIAAGGK